jgi:Flp pilus assembly protein TadG
MQDFLLGFNRLEMFRQIVHTALSRAHYLLTGGAVRSCRMFLLLWRLLHDRRGSIAVEFAILLPLQILLIFGGLDLVLATLTEERLNFATETAARCSAVKDPLCSTPDATSAWAAQQSVGVPNISAANFKVAFNNTACGGVSVVATYSYSGVVLPAVKLGAAACYDALR